MVSFQDFFVKGKKYELIGSEIVCFMLSYPCKNQDRIL